MPALPTKMTNIHAGCVILGRKGVLLLGPSGAGKSDLALRLIDGGARLVADDRTDLFVRSGRLFAAPPRAIAGLIELRGLGIIALPHAARAAVALAVQLSDPQMGDPLSQARLPAAEFYSPLNGAAPVPLMTLDAACASAAARIRLALAAFSKDLFRDSFNPR